MPALPFVPIALKGMLIAKGCWVLYRAYPALYQDAYTAYGFGTRMLKAGALARKSTKCRSFEDILAFTDKVEALQTAIRTDETSVEKHFAVARRLDDLATGAFHSLARHYVLRNDLEHHSVDRSAYEELLYTYLGLYLCGYCDAFIEDRREIEHVRAKLILLHEQLEVPGSGGIGDHAVRSVLQTLLPTKTNELRNALNRHILTDDLEKITEDEAALECVLYALGMYDVQYSHVEQPGTILAAHFRQRPPPKEV